MRASLSLALGAVIAATALVPQAGALVPARTALLSAELGPARTALLSDDALPLASASSGTKTNSGSVSSRTAKGPYPQPRTDEALSIEAGLLERATRAASQRRHKQSPQPRPFTPALNIHQGGNVHNVATLQSTAIGLVVLSFIVSVLLWALGRGETKKQPRDGTRSTDAASRSGAAASRSWSCGCGQVKIDLTGEPHFRAHCFCDDCHVRLRVAQSKEPGGLASSLAGSKHNEFASDGAVNLCAFWGCDVRVVQGSEHLAYYRAAVEKGGTVSVAAKSTTLNCYARCCGTLAFWLPDTPGFVPLSVGRDNERISGQPLPPVDASIMCKYCAVTGVPPPPKPNDTMPGGMLCSKVMGPMCCPCLSRGRGTDPLLQLAPKGVEAWNDIPIEYLTLDALPSPLFEPPRQTMGA